MVEILSKNGKNLLKTGVALILSNIATETLRQTSRETVQEISRDIRRFKANIKENGIRNSI